MKENEQIENANHKAMLNVIAILGKACSLMLQEKEGLILKMEDSMHNPFGESDKIVVTYINEELRFDNYDGELPDGSFVTIEDVDDTEEIREEEKIIIG